MTLHPEVARVMALPVRDVPHVVPSGWWAPHLETLDVTTWLLRPEHQHNPYAPRLKPIQSRSLVNLERARGLLAYVGVGRGKTLVCLLAGTLFPTVRQPLILTRAALVPQMRADLRTWAAWFQIHPALQVEAHDLCSTRRGEERFHALAPDLIMVDEADGFGKDSNRSRVLFSWMRGHPHTVVGFLSGTLIRDSIQNVDHLAAMALRARSPLPLTFPALQALSNAIDPAPLGLDQGGAGYWAPLQLPGRTLGESVQLRQAATVGVVMDTESDPLPTLVLHGVAAEHATAAVTPFMDKTGETWTLPSGDQFRHAVDLFRALRQLSQGFWYQWRWAHGVQDLPWLLAAEAWRTVRNAAVDRRDPARSTVGRITTLARTGVWVPPEWIQLQQESARYPGGRPPVDARWVTTAVMDAVVAHVRAQGVPMVLWVHHNAVGHKLQEITGWRYYSDGDGAALAEARATDTVICSIPAHGTGTNMQRWIRALVVEPWGNNHRAEQNIGRHHRPPELGQRAAELIQVDIMQHTWVLRRAIVRARRQAYAATEAMGRGQRLAYATFSGLFDVDNGRPNMFDDLWDDDDASPGLPGE